MRLHFFKFLISVFLICGLSSCNKTENETQSHTDTPLLHYALTPVLNKTSESNLAVTLTFAGDSDGNSRIYLGRAWADEQTPWTRFRDIKISSKNKDLPFTQEDGVMEINHAPNAPLTLRYSLYESDGRNPNGDSGYFYAPVVKSDIVHLIGWSSLAVPIVERGRNNLRTAKVALEWRDLPQNWETSTSLDVEGKTILPLNKIFRSAIMAGEFKVQLRDIGQKQLSVVTFGKRPFSDEAFADKLKKILTALNESWQDTPVDYQVSLLSMPPMENGSSITGTGLNHAFAAAGTPDLELGFLQMFLTHEMTHDWIPNRLGQFPKCEEENRDCSSSIYWFSEGFTDFYALSLLKDYEMISSSQFITKTNENLREYHLSPARNKTNSDIQEGFWSDPDIERQPYLRGFILAANWNQEIIEKTSGAKNLSNALRALKDKAAASEMLPELTQKYLTAHFSDWAGRDLSADIQTHMIEGITLTPVANAIGNCATLNIDDIYTYSLGFDVEASLRSKVFSGVDKMHNAYNAGLRDGMTFVRKVEGGGGDTTRPIVLEIKNKESLERVSYMPVGNKAFKVPQYKLSKRRGC